MNDNIKGKFYIPKDLIEKAELIKAKLQEEGKDSIKLNDIFESVIRSAFKKDTEVAINRVWSFEKAFFALRKTKKAELEKAIRWLLFPVASAVRQGRSCR
jgi:hypothetical protein